ncbi:hypothetical protein STEG23_001248, partial [Scotinomys teguina]
MENRVYPVVFLSNAHLPETSDCDLIWKLISKSLQGALCLLGPIAFSFVICIK